MARLKFNDVTIPPVITSDFDAALSYVLTSIFSGPSNITAFSDSPLLAKVMKETAKNDIINWPAMLNTGNVFSGFIEDAVDEAAFPASGLQYRKRLRAELTIGRYKMSSIVETSSSEETVVLNAKEASISPLMEDRLQAGADAIIRLLGSKLFTGTVDASSNIIGLDSLFDLLEYAGIPNGAADYTGLTPNVDYYPLWRALAGDVNTVANTLTYNDGHGIGGTLVAPTVDAVAADSDLIDWLDTFTTHIETMGRSYDLLVCSPRVALLYSTALNKRFTYNVPGGQQLVGDIGYTGLRYKGREIISDINCPDDSTIYLVTSSKIKMYTMPRTRVIYGSVADLIPPVGGFNVIAGAIPTPTTHLSRLELSVVPQLAIEPTGVFRLTWA